MASLYDDLIITHRVTGETRTFPFCGLNAEWNCRAWTLEESNRPVFLLDMEDGTFAVIRRDTPDVIKVMGSYETVSECIAFYDRYKTPGSLAARINP